MTRVTLDKGNSKSVLWKDSVPSHSVRIDGFLFTSNAPVCITIIKEDVNGTVPPVTMAKVRLSVNLPTVALPMFSETIGGRYQVVAEADFTEWGEKKSGSADVMMYCYSK